MTSEPRIVYNQPDTEYRTVDAANYSSLKDILDCPARYQWNRTHRVEKPAYDIGRVLHGLVLGVGEPVRVIDADSWRTKDACTERDEAYRLGEVPILVGEYERLRACADAVMAHELAGSLFDPGNGGHSEVSIYWTDELTGLACKGRIDRLVVTDDLHILTDLKTVTDTANPYAFGRKAATYRYHMQAAFYIDGYCTVTGTDPADVLWCNVLAESKPPHFVSAPELDAPSLDAGRARYQDALDILNGCLETGQWPAYPTDGTVLVSVPRYELKETQAA